MVVLIVDDDPVSLLLAEHVLRAGGYQVVTAVDVESAHVATDAQDFDIIVCDYMMPGATGLDFLEQLSDKLDEACPPFVLLTGVSEADDLDDQRVDLTSAYLTKPVKSDELLSVVGALLDGATNNDVRPTQPPGQDE